MKDENQNNPAIPGTPLRRSRFNFTNNRLETPPPPTPRPSRPAREKEADPGPRLVSQPHLTGRKGAHTEKTGSLIFNVSTLLHEFEGSHRDYDYEQDRLSLLLEGEADEKPTEATNIHGHVRLVKVLRDVLAQGPGEADVVLECVRCLNDFDYHVEYNLEEVYRPLIDLISGLPVQAETPDDEDDLKLDANHLLNLGEAIRQQILVSVPINPVCGDDCPGLADVLARVNSRSTIPDAEDDIEEEAEDDQTPALADPRWAALTQLLASDSDKAEKDK